MKRSLTITASVLGLLVVAAGLFLLWASSGRLNEDELVQTKRYSDAADAPPGDTVTVTTYNIGYLSGMTNNDPVVRPDSLFRANMDEATALLRRADPDVIGFQEIDFGAARSTSVHQLDTLAHRLGFSAAAQAVNWDERYVPFPYGRPAVHFGRILSGQAVLSRQSIRGHERFVLSRPDQFFIRDAFYLDRLAQVAVVDLRDRPLAVINVHLEAFDRETRERQAQTVNQLYRRVRDAELPAILMGDFNTLPPGAWSTLPPDQHRAFADDSTMERLLENTTLRPSYAVTGDTSNRPSPTFPADAPDRKLDYIFYRPAALELLDHETACGAPSPPSDHCAVTATFRLLQSTQEGSAPEVPSLDTLLTD